jgi:hypothetical protein
VPNPLTSQTPCSVTQRKPSRVALGPVVLLFYLISGCGGSNSTPTPAPSNLVYPQGKVAATLGVAIQTDTPTVTGTVSGYTVSPVLPAGLSLSPNTGAISGTPTAVAAQAAYTVTASNSTGSTTASVQIAVALAAPSNLVYPQANITATVGTAIQADTPTVIGTVAGFTVTPALPAGLSLDATTGTIGGTPIQAAVETAYTVTATNSVGNTTAQVTITVTQTSKVLLELGHGYPIVAVRTAGNRVLSEDTSGHWNLWDYTTGNIVVSGDGAAGGVSASPAAAPKGQIELAGQVAVVGNSTTVQILSAADGSVMSSVPNAVWWKLAADGSYLCTGSATALTVYSTSGAQDSTRTGDYSTAIAFAAPGQVQVATGPAGPNVIETVSVPSGTSSVSAPFQGNFYTWFLDGQRFLSTLSNTVWTYSNAAIQQGVVSLPSVMNLTGQGNWVWTTTSATVNGVVGDLVQIYPIGASSPSYSFLVEYGSQYFADGMTVGAFSFSQISILDLSGPTPSIVNYPVAPRAFGTAFAASSSSQWVSGGGTGAIVDGVSLSSSPRFFGYGAVQGIAATSSLVAISVPTGKILLLNPSDTTSQGTIDFWAGKVELSSDGSVLGATSGWTTPPLPDTTNFYSLPSLGSISSFTTQNPFGSDFSLSGSGTTIGILAHPGSIVATRTVSGLTGSPVIWSDSGVDAPIVLSPDGTLVAVADQSVSASGCSGHPPATNLYKNGTLVTAVDGRGEGWINNSQILVGNWDTCGFKELGWTFSGSTIYSSAGAVLATLPSTALPAISNPVFPTPDTVYDPVSNAVYSLTTGAVIWIAPSPTSYPFAGAVSGSYVVSQAGHQVLLYPY